jgi:hypothetical protein
LIPAIAFPYAARDEIARLSGRLDDDAVGRAAADASGLVVVAWSGLDAGSAGARLAVGARRRPPKATTLSPASVTASEAR